MTRDLVTLAQLPDHMASLDAHDALVRHCRASGVDTWSSRAFIDSIRDASLGLLDLGVEAGERVALMADSRPEWLMADLAILSARAVTVPIYPSLASNQAHYILNDAGVRVAIVSDAVQLAKVQEVRHLLPQLAYVIVFDPASEDAVAKAAARQGSVLAWGDLLARGRKLAVDASAVARRASRIADTRPQDLASLVYTSGTTGEPKGVMLTHLNLVSNLLGCQTVLEREPYDVAMTFLPLSHVFERMVVYYYLSVGVPLGFAESLDTIGRDLGVLQPTMMTGVPRVFEKIRGRVLEAVQAGSPLRRRMFYWGLGLGLKRVEAEQAQGGAPLPLSWQERIADRLVFTKIRARTGGRLRCIVSGSAPLAPDVAAFFAAVGLPIMEGYGLTETSPVLTVNRPGAIRIGTVGPPLFNVELRIASDGEILARGPSIMQGYWNKPVATAEALEPDGWFHTGDIGTLSADGYLSITDRKKDLIVTSGGKNLAPQPIEARLKQNPLVGEAMVIGDRRRFPAVLIMPDFRVLDERLRALGRPAGTREELVTRADVKALYQEIVDALNRELAHFEQLKQLALLPAEFSITTGELTPTLKVRRQVVEARWREVIERMYQSP